METDNKTAPVSPVQDQNQISLDLMNRMKMHGMAEAFRESLAGTTAQSMTPDSFLSMLLCPGMGLARSGRHCTSDPKCVIPLQSLYGRNRLHRQPGPRP